MNFIFPEILNVAENGRKRENTPYGVTRQEVAQGKGEKLSMSGFSDLGCCLVYLQFLCNSTMLMGNPSIKPKSQLPSLANGLPPPPF